MRATLLIAALGLALASLAAFSLSTGSARAADQTVDTGDLYFCAPSFENGVCDTAINVGDTVTWDVSSGFHTATQCDASFTTCPVAGGFDSGVLEPGESYSFTFNAAGTYPYRCEAHPDEMRGRVVVAAAQTASPTPVPTATAPGQTAATTTAAQSAGSGTLPRTGGAPIDSTANSTAIALAAAGLALLALSGASLAVARARR